MEEFLEVRERGVGELAALCLALLGAGGPIGIVEVEDRRLREEVRGPQARGMIGVPFDLRGPAVMALDQEADGFAAVMADGRVVVRNAGERVLGHLRVRKNSLERAAGAAFEGRDRGGHAREHHESTASGGCERTLRGG